MSKEYLIPASMEARLPFIEIEACEQFILKVNYKGLRVCNVLVTTDNMKIVIGKSSGTVDIKTQIVKTVSDEVIDEYNEVYLKKKK